MFSFVEKPRNDKHEILPEDLKKKNNLKMIRVVSSFADGPVNFNPTGPVEDQIQKLILRTEAS